MFGSEILEVAIGLILIFLLLSIICSAVREIIEAKRKSRSAYLEHGIRELLHDREGTGLAASFFTHPIIYGLYLDEYTPGTAARRPALLAKGSNLPSYIPARSFALALMDLAARGPTTDAVSSGPGATALSVETLRRNVQNLGNEPVQRVLLTALDGAGGDPERLQATLEAWYDSAMDRVSGWYKRSTQWVVFWVGLTAAVAMNVNTITLADYLYRNDTARQALVARAEAAAKDSGYVEQDYVRARAALDSLDLPVGWPDTRVVPARIDTWWERAWFFLLIPAAGWLLTALATTLGAPFWFDMLNKVMVIRSTVKPREKSPEEGSEDRQPRAARARRAAGGAAAEPAEEARPAPGTVAAGTTTQPRAEEDDAEDVLDACDVEMDDETPDEELPQAEGGVA
ncbi:MAG TPA: hypothetical protein VFQ45_14520 [Longimicrobium sp.]|nr:hypothetical protein [Longimicrobium sp.]